ncbi:hypothetical protein C7M84_022956 [Penaeus vannamei]|uniref:Uncharacterized protein n=1 Tax=Penaeus vannamei TaxID=6689 RepID=A0A423U5A1_PENVA|nr:hypothetical protein C7M84_022956 [Penaeus vannamei]
MVTAVFRLLSSSSLLFSSDLFRAFLSRPNFLLILSLLLFSSPHFSFLTSSHPLPPFSSLFHPILSSPLIPVLPSLLSPHFPPLSPLSSSPFLSFSFSRFSFLLSASAFPASSLSFLFSRPIFLSSSSPFSVSCGRHFPLLLLFTFFFVCSPQLFLLPFLAISSQPFSSPPPHSRFLSLRPTFFSCLFLPLLLLHAPTHVVLSCRWLSALSSSQCAPTFSLALFSLFFCLGRHFSFLALSPLVGSIAPLSSVLFFLSSRLAPLFSSLSVRRSLVIQPFSSSSFSLSLRSAPHFSLLLFLLSLGSPHFFSPVLFPPFCFSVALHFSAPRCFLTFLFLSPRTLPLLSFLRFFVCLAPQLFSPPLLLLSLALAPTFSLPFSSLFCCARSFFLRCSFPVLFFAPDFSLLFLLSHSALLRPGAFRGKRSRTGLLGKGSTRLLPHLLALPCFSLCPSLSFFLLLYCISLSVIFSASLPYMFLCRDLGSSSSPLHLNFPSPLSSSLQHSHRCNFSLPPPLPLLRFCSISTQAFPPPYFPLPAILPPLSFPFLRSPPLDSFVLPSPLMLLPSPLSSCNSCVLRLPSLTLPSPLPRYWLPRSPSLLTLRSLPSLLFLLASPLDSSLLPAPSFLSVLPPRSLSSSSLPCPSLTLAPRPLPRYLSCLPSFCTAVSSLPSAVLSSSSSLPLTLCLLPSSFALLARLPS